MMYGCPRVVAKYPTFHSFECSYQFMADLVFGLPLFCDPCTFEIELFFAFLFNLCYLDVFMMSVVMP